MPSAPPAATAPHTSHQNLCAEGDQAPTEASGANSLKVDHQYTVHAAETMAMVN